MRKIAVKARRKTKTFPYDVATQLRTPEEMAAYLDAWLSDAPDDATGIARALGDLARAKGMTQVARAAGLSRESLYKALSDSGNPSLETVLKVARALRLHCMRRRPRLEGKQPFNVLFRRVFCGTRKSTNSFDITGATPSRQINRP